MAQCHYHQESKGSAKCPTCQQFICDKCRMRGTSQRCMTCHSTHAKGGGEGKPKREMCTNHPDTPADQRCVRCKKIHCPACLNGATKCFRCALKPEVGAEGKRGTGSLKGKGGTGSLKGKGTGSLHRPSVPLWRRQGVSQVFGTLVLLGVCAAVLKYAVPAMGLDLPSFGIGGGKPFAGTAKIEFLAPGADKVLTGNTLMRFKIASSDDIDHVAVTVDGKYWERLKEAPFESEWQTQIFKNGAHTIMAKAVYRGGKKSATAIRKVRTKNKGV